MFNQSTDIHIGSEIKKRFDLSGMSQIAFGKLIGIPQSNIHRLFEKESIDTKRLILVCQALKFNFFDLYTDLESIKVIGSHNQINERDAHNNVNGSESVANLQKEIEYLKQQIKDKDKNISILEKINSLLEAQKE